MGMGDLLWPKHIYDGTKIRTSSKSTAKQRRCRMNNTVGRRGCFVRVSGEVGFVWTGTYQLGK